MKLHGAPGQVARDESLRDSRWLLAIGRLKSGASHWTAEADLGRIASQLAKSHPRTNGQSTVWVDPVVWATLGSTAGKLLVMRVTVGFVLAVANQVPLRGGGYRNFRVEDEPAG